MVRQKNADAVDRVKYRGFVDHRAQDAADEEDEGPGKAKLGGCRSLRLLPRPARPKQDVQSNNQRQRQNEPDRAGSREYDEDENGSLQNGHSDSRPSRSPVD